MGLLPVSTLTPGHFGTVTGSRASLLANVKSKAVSSPVRSSACIPKGNAKHHTIPIRLLQPDGRYCTTTSRQRREYTLARQTLETPESPPFHLWIAYG